MGFILRLFSLTLIFSFLFLSIPIPETSFLQKSARTPHDVIQTKRTNSLAYTQFFLKDSGNVSWLWEQYSAAPANLPGDDVLYWGSSLGPYHNYSEIIAHINDRVNEFPELLTVFNIGTSYNGLPIPCIQLTAPGDSSNRYGFVIVAHHHGREAITVENILFFLDHLLAYSSLPEVQRILNNLILYLIPTLNPDVLGILHINPWQRKNLHPTDEDGDGLVDEWEVQDVNGDHVVDVYEVEGESYYTYEGLDIDGDGNTGEDLPGGVDLNRNYPIAFTAGVDDPRSMVYHGEEPFSEPETQAMLNFTSHYHEKLLFGCSLHSGVAVLLTPWSFTSEPSYHEPFFSNLGAAVTAASGYEWWSATQLYPSFGTWDDWLYGEYEIPAVTLETYGNESAWGFSIWDYFNPSADQVVTNCNKVLNALMAMIEVLLDEPGDPSIMVPAVVSSVIPTLVSVHINESLSGFEILLLEYRLATINNFNWIGVPLIFQGGNRYHALVPAPLLGADMELRVYGEDFVGHTVNSEIVTYSVSAFLFVQLVCLFAILTVTIIIIVRFMVRLAKRKRR